MSKIRFTIGLVFATCVLSGTARAKEWFPAEIRRDLQLSYDVPCSVCHLKANTGAGTARTPFALSLRARGLDAENESSLPAALARLESESVDSDGDGTPDTAELRAATDPNSPANAGLTPNEDPSFGCGGSPAGERGPGRATLVAGGAGLAALRGRRRSARRAGRRSDGFAP